MILILDELTSRLEEVQNSDNPFISHCKGDVDLKSKTTLLA